MKYRYATKKPSPEKMKQTAFDMNTAEQKCLRLLACRDRSQAELRQRLLREGFSAQLADACLSRLVEIGIVDDRRFCETYLKSKVNSGWGMIRIINKLRCFGIDIQKYPSLASEYFDPDNELSRAQEQLKRYRGKAEDVCSGQYRYLLSKGYSPTVIAQVLRYSA